MPELSVSSFDKNMETQKHADCLANETWHCFDEGAVLEQLVTGKKGLDPGEAADRLRIYGPNALPLKEPPTIWGIILQQLKNPLNYILIAAAIVSLAIGEWTDAVFIIAIIVLNTTLGAYQEYNAEKSAASLQNLLKIKARVRRGNNEYEIPSEELVPGDLVVLEPGNKVPADLRLLEANNLSVDESFLTGESIATGKNTGILPSHTGAGERKNMVFAGSTITAGRGLGVVVGTGLQTEVGRIAKNVNESESAKPPLVIRIEKFTKQIGILVVFISIGLAIILRLQGMDLAAIFFFVVALAVSLIPEGLPVALTVALSIAVSRMAKRNVIVRNLLAVESLGSCTVIASDKTGTLTVNQQTARQVYLPGGRRFRISGEGYNGEGEFTNWEGTKISDQERLNLERLSQLAILANEGDLKRENGEWVHYGDAMDVAFLAMGYKLGLIPAEVRSAGRLLGSIPYEPERKFSAAFYEQNGTTYVAAKGAVETILNFCNSMRNQDGVVELDREEIEKQAETMAAQGYRVLAVAGAEYPGFKQREVYEDKDLPRMVFHGLVGFLDPLRPEAIEAVKKCKEAGIKVIMITGDHPGTALAISRELGLVGEVEVAVTGQQLSAVGSPDSPAYMKLVSSTHVFARVSPIQKLEIVEALINQGEYVAVTGDGVNDAPALRRANIGVAMGSGTEVAKEISSMIVTDDNFASIVAGVEEGRFAYDNVRKVTYMLISTGAAEVTLVLASILFGLPLPLLAVQILWLNLATNGIQDIAMAFEAGEPGAMKRKPRRPNEKIFNSQMISQTLVAGLTIGLISFSCWYFLLEVRMMDEFHARNINLLLMVLMQNVHSFSCRSEYVSAFKIPFSRNYFLVFAVLAAQGIHILSMHLPFMQQILRLAPITLVEWVEVFILALPVLLVMEIYKKINARFLERNEGGNY